MSYRPGDRVRVAPLAAAGTVRGTRGDKYEVGLGTLVAVCGAADLEPLPPAPAPDPTPVVTVHFAAAADELDIHSHTRAEAEPKVEQFLNRAWLGKRGRVRIVHGKGGGVLQQFLRDYLAGHPLVVRYAYGAYGEGDTGVTVVDLAPGNEAVPATGTQEERER